MPAASDAVSSSTPITRTIAVDLLALDLGTCGRCVGTDRNLAAAAELLRERLRAQGVALRVRKTVVSTAEDAVRLRFASSPTIRVDGRDIAPELRENECGDCADLCGCAEGVTCRVWTWKGREHVEAPTGMIVEAILGAAREPAPIASAPESPFRLPANLERFFAARDRGRSATSSCCPPRPEGCCEPAR